jgi:GST-like protein
MIDLHYWPTPNGHKITLFLEETGLPYRIVPVNIGAGEQFKMGFLEIAPNNRMPVIVDHKPDDGGDPISVFESGAILMYLGDKTGKFLPKEPRNRKAVLEWLFWQVGGLGPMSGQRTHFAHYAPVQLQYAIDRYTNEVNRLYGVMDSRLNGRPFLTGDSYSIADMACYPWVEPWEMQGQKISDFPNLKRWLDAIASRPATLRAYERGKAVWEGPSAASTEEGRKILFGQTAETLRKARSG